MISELPGDGVKYISKLQSHCANMDFSEKADMIGFCHQVTHKLGESPMNYIKIFHNTQALSVSVGNSYSGDQLMNIFLDKFHQGVNTLHR